MTLLDSASDTKCVQSLGLRFNTTGTVVSMLKRSLQCIWWAIAKKRSSLSEEKGEHVLLCTVNVSITINAQSVAETVCCEEHIDTEC